MKSPFPGMDPYLERYWGDVHTRLATYASDQLQNQLPPDLIACIDEDVSVQSDEPNDYRPQTYYPDVRIEEFRNGKAEFQESNGVVAVAESIEVERIVEPFTQRSIRIVEPHSGNRVITAIELLSPSNKIGTAGREAFQKKRVESLQAGVNLVEIDLIRQGLPNLAVPTSQVPAEYLSPYRICVVRSWRVEKAQLYRVSLRTRLPIISVPLREKDKEAALDLQALIEMAYENGRYYRRGYAGDPVPPLTGEDAEWADQLLRERGLR